MKNFIKLFSISLFCFFITNLFAQEKKINHSNGHALVDVTSTSMDNLEMEMFKEMNLVRTDPKGYKKYVEAYMKANGIIKDKHSYFTDAEDLLNDLDSLADNIASGKIPARTKLKTNDCLFKTARIHAEDQGATGSLNHNNTKGEDPGKRIANNCPQEFDEWIWIGNKAKVNGMENIEGGTYAVNARAANINLLIDGGLGPSHGHRWTMLRPEATHGTAFIYKDNVGGSVWNRWIQMFAIDKATAAAMNKTTASSNNPSSTTQPTNTTTTSPTNNSNTGSSTGIAANSPDCKCDGSMGSGTNAATVTTYHCTENGVTKYLSKECYDKLNSGFGGFGGFGDGGK